MIRPFLLSLGCLIFAVDSTWAESRRLQNIPSENVNRVVEDKTLKGSFTVSNLRTYGQTLFGGISGIAYNGNRDVFYAVSDDSNQPRFYTIVLDKGSGDFKESNFRILDVTLLRRSDNSLFPTGTFTPQGIAFAKNRLYISQSGNSDAGTPPTVNEFNLNGVEIEPAFDMPSSFDFTDLELASLTVQPNADYLWTAPAGALGADGTAATLDEGTLVRLTRFSVGGRSSSDQYVYETDPIQEAPDPSDGTAFNHLVEILAIDDNGTFLGLERSFSEGKGYNVRVYMFFCLDTLDVSSVSALQDGDVRLGIIDSLLKRLVFDLQKDLEVAPQNIEAMTIRVMRSRSRRGRRRNLQASSTNDVFQLVLVSDNDFSAPTQFVVVNLDVDSSIAVVPPVIETPSFLNITNADQFGTVSDPAVWLSPIDPEESLVIATLREGGLATFDLEGNLVQLADVGNVDFRQVEIMYSFELLDASLIDVAVVTDNRNDNLFFYEIDPETRLLFDITSTDSGLFDSRVFLFPGFTDRAADALAVYTSPYTCDRYAFVSLEKYNLIKQILLADDGNGRIAADIVVRNITLPRAAGYTEEESAVGGMTVDEEIGFLYVSIPRHTGILRFDAEPFPPTEDDFERVADTLDVESLTVYHGGEFEGFLLASTPFDSTFQVYEREYENDFLGAFTLGENSPIDRTDNTQGIHVLNVDLGSTFECGIFVAQDDENDPASVVNNNEFLSNVNTNLKFVPFEDVAENVVNKLGLDTAAWGPRRFSLALLVDALAQEIYCAIPNADVYPRDAEELLYYLNEASRILYKPGTKKRRLISASRKSSRSEGMTFFPYYRQLAQDGTTVHGSRGVSSSSSSAKKSSRLLSSDSRALTKTGMMYRMERTRTRSRCPTRSGRRHRDRDRYRYGYKSKGMSGYMSGKMYVMGGYSGIAESSENVYDEVEELLLLFSLHVNRMITRNRITLIAGAVLLAKADGIIDALPEHN